MAGPDAYRMTFLHLSSCLADEVLFHTQPILVGVRKPRELIIRHHQLFIIYIFFSSFSIWTIGLTKIND